MKNIRLSLISLALCIGSIVSACHHGDQPAPAQNAQDTTIQNPKPQGIHTDTLGAGSWTVIINVQDSKASPYMGAIVTAPCTGWPSKTTDASGMVAFSGTGPCPCSHSPATVTTTKGCNIKVNVSCDTTIAICNQ
jgi:hypothetical protein